MVTSRIIVLDKDKKDKKKLLLPRNQYMSFKNPIVPIKCSFRGVALDDLTGTNTISNIPIQRVKFKRSQTRIMKYDQSILDLQEDTKSESISDSSFFSAKNSLSNPPKNTPSSKPSKTPKNPQNPQNPQNLPSFIKPPKTSPPQHPSKSPKPPCSLNLKLPIIRQISKAIKENPVVRQCILEENLTMEEIRWKSCSGNNPKGSTRLRADGKSFENKSGRRADEGGFGKRGLRSGAGKLPRTKKEKKRNVLIQLCFLGDACWRRREGVY
ncbi:unnamed protein product [Moneuplotes crassus]|uniref:Uncharacterized protein n=1 Tax=Euplotes crassus TaxID=5936 RepID=A0AAD2DAH7_EUPCR|nr:unnamed protein product [Moneuplotes crassus]